MGAPSETPAPQKKRRRRWLTVPFLLLLATLAWWFYPRGDARLVGHWQFQEIRLGTISSLLNLNLKPRPLFHIDLQSNGLAVLRSVITSSNGPLQLGPPVYTRWKLDGDSLIIGNPDRQPVNSYVTSVAKLLSRHLSINLMTDSGIRMTVVSVDPNRIDLQPPGPAAALPFNPNLLSPIQFHLTRLPE